MDFDSVFFNISAFIAGLFLLEFGADRFIDNTAVVALRLGVSQTLVALLTAGAEWEELAVVISSLLQHRTPLALGNVIGSTISNILGAFSLGLLFHPDSIAITFDHSAKVYTSVLFALTTAITALGLSGFLQGLSGIILTAAFGIYILSITFAIYKGAVAPPEDSDSDSEVDSDDGAPAGYFPTEDTSLLPPPSASNSPRPRSLTYHITQLLLGFLALSLSGYVLSHSAASLADAFSLSGTVIGVTILAFATTLPEKFVAIMSSARGHGGIMVANTAGSNIFLLTLCLGITLVAGDAEDLAVALEPFEIVTMWVASALLFGVVWVAARRWVGGVLLGLYLGFVVLEFTVYRR